MSTRYQLNDEVAVVTMDRPDRYNAIDTSLSGSSRGPSNLGSSTQATTALGEAAHIVG